MSVQEGNSRQPTELVADAVLHLSYYHVECRYVYDTGEWKNSTWISCFDDISLIKFLRLVCITRHWRKILQQTEDWTWPYHNSSETKWLTRTSKLLEVIPRFRDFARTNAFTHCVVSKAVVTQHSFRTENNSLYWNVSNAKDGKITKWSSN